MEKVCEYEGSSLWGMNGGQPESPDETLLVYAKKPDLEDMKSKLLKSGSVIEIHCRMLDMCLP